MQDHFVTFRKTSDQGLIETIKTILSENGLPYELSDDSPMLDSIYIGGTELQNKMEIKVRQSDFERATNLLEAEVEMQLRDIDPGHYLFQFSDEELYEVISKPDEWNALDFKLAQKILNDRGIKVNDAVIDDLKEQRLFDLAKPEDGQSGWLVLGYLVAILGGFFGIFAGWHLWKFKKTLPNGDRIYTYTEGHRKHGQVIFFMSLILFCAYFLYFNLRQQIW